MRTYAYNTVVKLPTYGAYAPFPGRHPIRLLWRTGGGETYIGKPSRAQVRRFRRLAFETGLTRPSWHVIIFDRTTRLYDAAYDETTAQLLNTARSDKLFCYMPWSKVDTGLSCFDRFFFKKFGGYRLYSPYPVCKTNRVKAYKDKMAQLVLGDHGTIQGT